MGVKSTGPRPTDALECVYRLDGEDASWITAVNAAAFPDVESEHRMALRVQLGDEGWYLIDAPGTSKELEARIRQQMGRFSPQYVSRLLRDTPSCVTLTQLADELGPLGLRVDMELADFVWLKIWNGGDQLILIGAAYAETQVVSRTQRRRWEAIAAHTSAAFQLRRALRRRSALGDAVLTLEGRLERASAPGRGGPRARLRERVVMHDRAVSAPACVGAAALWEPLVEGDWTLVDRFDRDGKHFVVAVVNPAVEGRPDAALGERERAVAQLAALGMTNADICAALALSRSAVSVALTNAMARLAVRDRALLPLVFDDWARAHRMTIGGVELRVGVHELAVPDSLTPAEAEVTLLAARGLSDAAIAKRRGSSSRTVANQLRNVYRKRGLSNRTELIRDMFRVPADPPHADGVA